MNTLIISIFIIGYVVIAFEHPFKINKSATALLTGVLCWAVYILMGSDSHFINEQLTEHIGELSGILFFLITGSVTANIFFPVGTFMAERFG